MKLYYKAENTAIKSSCSFNVRDLFLQCIASTTIRQKLLGQNDHKCGLLQFQGPLNRWVVRVKKLQNTIVIHQQMAAYELMFVG